jgi:hypothetical protein
MMANPNKVRNSIAIILERYGLYLKFRTMGAAALSKAELLQLVRSGMIKPSDLRKPVIMDAYMKAHEQLLRGSSRKAVREYALDHIRESAGRFVDKFVDKAAAEIGGVAEQMMLEQRQHAISTARGEMVEGAGRRTSAEIARRIREKSGDLFKDWDRVVTSELAQATNLGAFDAIVENNRNKAPDEILVYKAGPHDGKTCKHCAKFWFTEDGITPRVYKLSELMKNGSNFGRKSADWKPTVGITHPNERHFLLELPKSWGFKSGEIAYIEQGHDEWKVQRGR